MLRNYWRPLKAFANMGYIYSLFGEGNGTPLQYSCLENPMDGGSWWAAVYGVARSWTQLSNFTFTFHFHALEKEMATHSSVLAWRIAGTAEPGGLPSVGLHSQTRLKRLSSSSIIMSPAEETLTMIMKTCSRSQNQWVQRWNLNPSLSIELGSGYYLMSGYLWDSGAPKRGNLSSFTPSS